MKIVFFQASEDCDGRTESTKDSHLVPATYAQFETSIELAVK